ncbi:(1-_4)-alpha-D-glucan 1-alpha-D-glucosylmutase [Candidatus Pantoea symbiotica]|jgi:(1->4)-alpha-D-glucan 1-alpha-D-glucosylmutase|uniref:(1->4)-alpha-D-glucan 1-alpha-D-glucosylmutase n=1 Tax=Candidatus Pantoea symbiotica TaxID=1884370 RepID=A0A1I3ZJI6_9GAMM|nr:MULTISPECIES: malto-oligosyltrehalose synthase [Pantoea]KAJ9430015.1 malto-oligosyltrehalose synthase [Pantoea sp. YR343]MRT26952.1 malto-oligosyltrehalose synthase [Enterobacteriaceae bacterium RIT697]SFK44258.1 (1->4)-alpha-D-glucan 1-alpha-D-glucosylmutase [Pantoea symbiotica]SFU93325.1 (1->4)-alpha-D-glucan 1-alpha-D-glucosylmutase [Pantoea sp. YR525]
MSIPTATYRIQFRNGMTFDRAAALVPYLQRLGISHLYASPIFSATAESTHGYDVTDANEIEPAIGGRDGFNRLVEALQDAEIGLILDIVPNHMAASLENNWWRDVIEYGESSRYANHFDIDWTRRLTLPFLGDSFENVLENGELSIKAHPETGHPALAYYDSFYPLTPASWQDRADEVLAITDAKAIAELHDQQPWRLISWRDARSELSYRRFFEITGLVGVRVEDEAVFADSHQLILELVRSGAVSGLRVDHVDGLADPQGYLRQLRQATGPDCYITVEKILAEGEQIPDDWPISGTTGYEFIAALSHALVNDSQIDTLHLAYEAITGQRNDVEGGLRVARELMVDRNFAGEFARLLKLATQIATSEHRNLGEAELHVALREILIAFPVYRTYGQQDGMPLEGEELLQQVLEIVKNSASPTVLSLLQAMLLGAVSEESEKDAHEFRVRFQQLTGPLMAKSVEDTLFFRNHVALAINEVGAEPLPHAFSLAHFHSEMQTRLQQQPDGISSTSTHDTKRGEDARARLYTLSEAPALWAEHVTRWRQINQAQVVELEDGAAPEPAVEWMLYQALAGVWPTTLQPQDASQLEERFIPFVEKALREAKLRTDWAESNEAYENAVLDYARHLLSPANQLFLSDFSHALQPFIQAGLINSLTQTVIKLTAPGVPDIYQGSEALDFSLVDPDNRRTPDFDLLEQQLEESESPDFNDAQNWLSGKLKQEVIARLLHLRRDYPQLFRVGDYQPLQVSGEHQEKVIAFARQDSDHALLVILPRLSFDNAQWTQTEVVLTESLAHRHYRNLWTGASVAIGDYIALDEAASSAPLVLLSS